jgi:sulfoacetaldehyde dehydrogenase
MSTVSAIRQDLSPERAAVDELVSKARVAMREYAKADQARVDEAVTALAWSIYKPENARMMAELAVKDTGLGNVPDKIVKKQRKTFGTLRDLMRVKTVGVIEEDPRRASSNTRSRSASSPRSVRPPTPVRHRSIRR